MKVVVHKYLSHRADRLCFRGLLGGTGGDVSPVMAQGAELGREGGRRPAEPRAATLNLQSRSGPTERVAFSDLAAEPARGATRIPPLAGWVTFVITDCTLPARGLPSLYLKQSTIQLRLEEKQGASLLV